MLSFLFFVLFVVWFSYLVFMYSLFECVRAFVCSVCVCMGICVSVYLCVCALFVAFQELLHKINHSSTTVPHYRKIEFWEMVATASLIHTTNTRSTSMFQYLLKIF
eukprot:m.130986 g.130986  ORF g.130986 m.130986 type:complete len:106 (+) comp29515_c0_seq3:663-980(+)